MLTQSRGQHTFCKELANLFSVLYVYKKKKKKSQVKGSMVLKNIKPQHYGMKGMTKIS